VTIDHQIWNVTTGIVLTVLSLSGSREDTLKGMPGGFITIVYLVIIVARSTKLSICVMFKWIYSIPVTKSPRFVAETM